MNMTEAAPQPTLIARHYDDVDVVGHQAIGPDFHPRPLRTVREQIEVKRIVAVFEEHALTAIAALSDVVRDARQDETREAAHLGRL